MKVLQINAVCGIGSTGRMVLEAATVLESLGYEYTVAYAQSSVDYKNSYRIGGTFGRKLHALLSRLTGLQGYFSRWSTRKLLKFMDHLHPDIVHISNLHSNFIHIPMLLAYLKKKDIATVVTLHDCFFFTGKCSHYTMMGCYKWHTGCGDCPRLHIDNASWFFDRTKKMFIDKKKDFQSIHRLAVVGVSDWITNEARKSFLGQAQIITRIYNWIDTDIFKPTESNLKMVLGAQGKFVILGVSYNWSVNKGLEDFITLAGMLGQDECIVLVGNVPGNVQLPKNIINISPINDPKQLVTYYSMADVFFNPSVEETFGSVTAEALACGTPLVVYNTTACPEHVGEHCGAVVELKNTTEAYREILKIKQNGKQYYSVFCRDFAGQNFDKSTNIQQYIDLYRKLLKG